MLFRSSANASSLFSTGGIRDAVWNGSIWVAVGAGTNSIAYSSDGLSWTGLGTSVFTQGLRVVWNGKIFVATGTGTYTMATSANGIQWSGISDNVFGGTPTINALAFNGLQWMAGSDGSSNRIIQSRNGINWTGLNTTSIFSECVALIWNGSVWVAGGAYNSTGRIAYSSDNGITWNVITSSTTANGSYAWVVPNTPSSSVKIKLTDLTEIGRAHV